jgi:hypothetical protein
MVMNIIFPFVFFLIVFKRLLAAQNMSCVSNESPLLVEKETDFLVPNDLTPILEVNPHSYLAGQCFILLGDSTLSETGIDLGFLMECGGNKCINSTETYLQWAHFSCNQPVQQTSFFRGRFMNASFFHGNRHWLLESPVYNVTVYMHFIGHANFRDNFQGLQSLLDQTVQQRILHNVNTYCGSRPRVLWLNSGYHDMRAANHHPERFEDIFDWLSSNVVPSISSRSGDVINSLFLSRQPPPSYPPGHRLTMIERLQGDPKRMIAFNSFIKNITDHKGGWTYVDYKEALACHKNGSTYGLHGHIGAIGKYIDSVNFHNQYLSILQTMLALKYTTKDL